MSTIVKIRDKKSGRVYAYEQTARWDPKKGQSRPTRRYLGRYDEETDTIIPSSGRRGRKPRDPQPAASAAQPSAAPRADDGLAALRDENERLGGALSEAAAALREALATVESLAG